jgi:hypothetical protein
MKDPNNREKRAALESLTTKAAVQTSLVADATEQIKNKKLIGKYFSVFHGFYSIL